MKAEFYFPEGLVNHDYISEGEEGMAYDVESLIKKAIVELPLIPVAGMYLQLDEWEDEFNLNDEQKDWLEDNTAFYIIKRVIIKKNQVCLDLVFTP